MTYELPTSGQRIRFQRPDLPSLNEVAPHWEAARSAHWYSNGGPVLAAFSSAIERYLGSDLHAVPVNNATSGLMVALRALCGTGRGATVLMPSYTFAATATAAVWAGFTPAFVDVSEDHWHADPAMLQEAVERETPAALLLCSTYGVAPPRATVRSWSAIAEHANIPLIVDSAAGFGSRDECGNRLGGQADAEVFSFHATKPFAIGEGGLVTTRDPDIAVELRRAANFGFHNDRIVRSGVGMNAKMDDLHAAIGLAVLDRFDEVLKRRQGYGSRLSDAFSAAGLSPQPGMSAGAVQFLPLLCKTKEQRSRLLASADRRAIELRTYFSDPLHSMPAFSRYRKTTPLPVTESLAARIACLPIYSDMSAGVLGRIEQLSTDIQ
ncbi:DegT/DnrJ/EryC1/StrS family aminotransferase [Terrabacter terrae]|uniref:DegT/DnrJ/EryC1/StrS family aminotransferase n=1 Tax=Terrabacter terrae TaxID=318434 RepID=A0ABP5F881_9MICO